MSLTKPEPGMTYDFEVMDVFQIQGKVIFVGYPSISYQQLFPVNANIIVDDVGIDTVRIDSQEMLKVLDLSQRDMKAICTSNFFDITALKNKKIRLSCTFL